MTIMPKSLEKLQNDSEELADINAYDRAVESAEEFFPFEISERSVKGKNRIILFREYREMTQQQLANKVGITRNYISLLEIGKKTRQHFCIKENSKNT